VGQRVLGSIRRKYRAATTEDHQVRPQAHRIRINSCTLIGFLEDTVGNVLREGLLSLPPPGIPEEGESEIKADGNHGMTFIINAQAARSAFKKTIWGRRS
jgi:hypothetical protein